MEKIIHDEKNGIDYKLVGDYYIPCLKAPEAPKVGRFGMLYHNYLCKHKRVTYSGLMLSGKLKEHIEDIDRQAEDMFSQLVDRMKQNEGITEKIKAADQMEWVRRMNSIRNRAIEIINKRTYPLLNAKAVRMLIIVPPLTILTFTKLRSFSRSF